MRRLIFPVLLGVVGVAILVSLGNWQARRLVWKEAILAEIDARMASAPVAMTPDQLTEADDEYRPVAITGAFTGERVIVLTSLDGRGPGFRVIEVFETDGGDRIFADRGFLADEDRGAELSAAPGTWEGNLSWPDEVDRFTPAPEGELWFARDLPAMAEALGARPVLAVLSAQTDPLLTPMPIDTADIKNDHREYMITWYLLAVVWAVMSGYLGLRVLRRKD